MSAERPAKGLGRGLSALIGDADKGRPSGDESAGAEEGIREVEIGRIRPNPAQPRTNFDESALQQLAQSITDRGVLQPILLRPTDIGYQIIAGERRWRAAQRAGLHRIPAIIRNVDDDSTAELALIENIQREDLNAIEEAEGYRQLIERHGHTQDGVARIVQKSRSHITNLLRLLNLPEFVRLSLFQGNITMGHARAIAAAPDPEALTREIIAKGLSVRQAEARAKSAKRGPSELILTERPIDADLAALERQLTDLLGVKVQVGHKGNNGTVTLSYSSLDQLDMICQRLSGEPI
ncbi:MAG: ParB/RepB/Spo0J family partition protein [Sphingomonas sp.]|nr:ParB/RepB/Spo0J family partition protein [Sphingomonas sp.]